MRLKKKITIRKRNIFDFVEVLFDLFFGARESVCVLYIYFFFCCTPFGCCDQKWALKASALSFYSSAELTHTLTPTLTHTCCCRLRRRLSQRWQRHVKMRRKSFHKQLLLTFSFKFRYFSCLLRSATTMRKATTTYAMLPAVITHSMLQIIQPCIGMFPARETDSKKSLRIEAA